METVLNREVKRELQLRDSLFDLEFICAVCGADDAYLIKDEDDGNLYVFCQDCKNCDSFE